MRRIPVGAVAVAGLILALSLAEGGYSGEALGAFTAATWVLVLVAAVGLPGEVRSIARPVAIGAFLLAALLALTTLSLGWGYDDGEGFIEVVRLAGYLGVFVLAGLLARPGSGASLLLGVGLGW